MEREHYMKSASGLGDVYVKEWAPEGEVRAVLQLTHGMAEHIARYGAFAGFLNENGILVVGLDLPGHGKSIGQNGTPGSLAEENGWSRAVLDMRTLYEKTHAEHADVPYVLFGHSMGSFLARTYAARYGMDMDAFIFSGTSGKNPAVPIAKLLAKGEIKKNGGRAQSARLNGLSFGAYNKAFTPNRTEFDWLSRDEAEVDRYVADEHCGFVFTAGGFLDLFDGLSEIGSKTWAARVPQKPVLLISGAKDPVGGNGRGVKEVAALLEKTGHDVTLHLYSECRHELLNELNREEVYRDILRFMEEKVF